MHDRLIDKDFHVTIEKPCNFDGSFYNDEIENHIFIENFQSKESYQDINNRKKNGQDNNLFI